MVFFYFLLSFHSLSSLVSWEMNTPLSSKETFLSLLSFLLPFTCCVWQEMKQNTESNRKHAMDKHNWIRISNIYRQTRIGEDSHWLRRLLARRKWLRCAIPSGRWTNTLQDREWEGNSRDMTTVPRFPPPSSSWQSYHSKEWEEETSDDKKRQQRKISGGEKYQRPGKHFSSSRPPFVSEICIRSKSLCKFGKTFLKLPMPFLGRWKCAGHEEGWNEWKEENRTRYRRREASRFLPCVVIESAIPTTVNLCESLWIFHAPFLICIQVHAWLLDYMFLLESVSSLFPSKE